MHYYIFAGILFGLYCLILELVKAERKVILLMPALILMAFFIGFRDFSIGTDTITYVQIYQYTPPLSDYLINFEPGFHAGRMEWGFFILLSILKEFLIPAKLALVIISFISLLFFAIAYKRLCPNYYIGILLLTVSAFFLSFEYNILRQGIAGGISMLALSYLITRQYIAYFACVLFAATFHIIALVSLAIFPFRKIQWQSKHFILVAIALTLAVFIDVISLVLLELKEVSIVFWRVYLYVQGNTSELKIISWMYLSTIVLISLSIYFVDHIRLKYQHIDIIITFVLIGVFGVLLTQDLPLLAIRLGFVFFIAEPILIMALFTLWKDELPKALLIYLFAILMLTKNIYITAKFMSPYFY